MHHHFHRLGKIAAPVQKRNVVQHTGIVHQNVEPAGLGDGVEQRIRIGQINAREGNSKLGGGGAPHRLVTGRQGYLTAARLQAGGNGAAYATVGPGDQGGGVQRADQGLRQTRGAAMRRASAKDSRRLRPSSHRCSRAQARLSRIVRRWLSAKSGWSRSTSVRR